MNVPVPVPEETQPDVGMGARAEKSALEAANDVGRTRSGASHTGATWPAFLRRAGAVARRNAAMSG